MNVGDDNSDFIFYYSPINSIYYQLNQGESLIFRNNDINITAMDLYFKEKKYVNFMIYPSSGLSTILFYVEYIFDITNYNNQLKFLQFDDSVYSINLKLDNNYITNINSSNNYNYIFFQCLSCNLVQSNVIFKYNNNTFSEDKNNDNNNFIKAISLGNIIGYIKLNVHKDIITDDNLFINIIKPYHTYIKYYYTPKINMDYIYQNNYNINIEKDNNQNGFIISFDRFIKKTKTNYTILILNKIEIKKPITNECEFFSYLEKRINITSMKYLSFIDMNENNRIKKNITFEEIGNYAIYIMAQTIDNLSIYKYLGTESYSYTNDLYQNTSNEQIGNNHMEIIAIFIFIILFFILIILYCIFRRVRKKKLIKLFNTINNNSLLPEDLDNLQSSINKLIEHNNIKYQNKINNDNNFLLFDKPSLENEEEKENNRYNNNKINNNIENNDMEFEQGQSAAPLLGDTYCSEEDRIKNELAKIKKSSNKIKKNNNEKMYINTNEGNG